MRNARPDKLSLINLKGRKRPIYITLQSHCLASLDHPSHFIFQPKLAVMNTNGTAFSIFFVISKRLEADNRIICFTIPQQVDFDEMSFSLLTSTVLTTVK